MKAALLALPIISLLICSQPAAEEIIVFTNVNLVPMTTNRVMSGQTVIVSGGKISRIGPTRKISIPPRQLRQE